MHNSHLFTVQSDGPDRTGLVAFAQRYVDKQWVPTQLTPDQAREFVLDQFKRAVAVLLLVWVAHGKSARRERQPLEEGKRSCPEAPSSCSP
jgi:hypothetical protein